MRLIAIQNNMAGKIRKRNRDRVRGGWRKLCDEGLHNTYVPITKYQSDKMEQDMVKREYRIRKNIGKKET